MLTITTKICNKTTRKKSLLDRIRSEFYLRKSNQSKFFIRKFKVIVNWFPLVYYYYTKYEQDMVVSQEPDMWFSQNNFSLDTLESKWVWFLAAATAHDTKWLWHFRHFSGGLTRFHSFRAVFPIITHQCCESAAQSDPCWYMAMHQTVGLHTHNVHLVFQVFGMLGLLFLNIIKTRVSINNPSLYFGLWIIVVELQKNQSTRSLN